MAWARVQNENLGAGYIFPTNLFDPVAQQPLSPRPLYISPSLHLRRVSTPFVGSNYRSLY
jgi:hypothetical protein